MSSHDRLTMLNGTPIPYTASFAELCRNLKSPGPLAWASIMALGYQDSDDAFQELVELSQSTDWRFRRSAVEALAHHSRVGDAQNVIERALNDTSPYVVRTACEVVGNLKLSTLHDNVATLLNSKYPVTRQSALRVLSQLWHESDFPMVFHIFISDGNESVRKEAAWVLRDHPSKENWLELFQAWWQDPLGRHRRWSCELATTFGASKVEKELKELSGDADGHVRKAAASALSLIKL